jgi:hypothetical protein
MAHSSSLHRSTRGGSTDSRSRGIREPAALLTRESGWQAGRAGVPGSAALTECTKAPKEEKYNGELAGQPQQEDLHQCAEAGQNQQLAVSTAGAPGECRLPPASPPGEAGETSGTPTQQQVEQAAQQQQQPSPAQQVQQRPAQQVQQQVQQQGPAFTM